MAHFNPFENPYSFVDPFRPSISFSLANIPTRRRQEETTIDNIPLPPPHFLPQECTQAPGYVSPTQKRQRREPSPLYYSPAPTTISRHSSSSPPASTSRNTFGGKAAGTRNDRSHSRAPTVSSAKLRGSTSPSPRPRSDREEALHITVPHDSESAERRSVGDESINQDLEYPHLSNPPIPRSGSGQSCANHRRRNLSSNRNPCTEAKCSRDPEIILENRISRPSSIHFGRSSSSNAIPYYKPSTRSSQVALPSSSPYPASHLPRTFHAPTPAHSISSTHPASQPALVQHPLHSPNLIIYIFAFLFDTLPRQIYLNLMLRLPYLYFIHVVRVFEDAEMSMPEIKEMALEAINYLKNPTTDISKVLHLGSNPRYDNLSKSWGAFVDSLIREWRTMNIISVLLLSAILTILQIPSAANDPVTRYAALLSMICAIMSLLYGGIYFIHFGTMRSTCKAAEWAHEAQKATTGIFWNVWVFLAIPATWLVWSIISFVVCIMAFVWRTGTIDDVSRTPLTSHDVLAPRIIVSFVLALGLTYLILIRATFQKYGIAMDRAWRTRVLAWMHEKSYQNAHIDPSPKRFQESLLLSSSNKSLPLPPIHYSSQHLPNAPPPPVVVSSSSAQAFQQERPRGRSTSIKPIS